MVKQSILILFLVAAVFISKLNGDEVVIPLKENKPIVIPSNTVVSKIQINAKPIETEGQEHRLQDKTVNGHIKEGDDDNEKVKINNSNVQTEIHIEKLPVLDIGSKKKERKIENREGTDSYFKREQSKIYDDSDGAETDEVLEVPSAIQTPNKIGQLVVNHKGELIDNEDPLDDLNESMNVRRVDNFRKKDNTIFSDQEFKRKFEQLDSEISKLTQQSNSNRQQPIKNNLRDKYYQQNSQAGDYDNDDYSEDYQMEVMNKIHTTGSSNRRNTVAFEITGKITRDGITYYLAPNNIIYADKREANDKDDDYFSDLGRQAPKEEKGPNGENICRYGKVVIYTHGKCDITDNNKVHVINLGDQDGIEIIEKNDTNVKDENKKRKSGSKKQKQKKGNDDILENDEQDEDHDVSFMKDDDDGVLLRRVDKNSSKKYTAQRRRIETLRKQMEKEFKKLDKERRELEKLRKNKNRRNNSNRKRSRTQNRKRPSSVNENKKKRRKRTNKS